jgi:hypothetical protein
MISIPSGESGRSFAGRPGTKVGLRTIQRQRRRNTPNRSMPRLAQEGAQTGKGPRAYLRRAVPAAETGVEWVRVSDPSSTPAVSAEPSSRQSNPRGVFMSLSPKTHVSVPRSPNPASFGLLQPPAKPLVHPRTPAPQPKSESARYTLEYENPDLTVPSVSSF